MKNLKNILTNPIVETSLRLVSPRAALIAELVLLASENIFDKKDDEETKKILESLDTRLSKHLNEIILPETTDARRNN